jgi:hypothetical protein
MDRLPQPHPVQGVGSRPGADPLQGRVGEGARRAVQPLRLGDAPGRLGRPGHAPRAGTRLAVRALARKELEKARLTGALLPGVRGGHRVSTRRAGGLPRAYPACGRGTARKKPRSTACAIIALA